MPKENFKIKLYTCRPFPYNVFITLYGKGGEKKVGDTVGMTDNQLKIYNKLLKFIRKLLKLVPNEKRDSLEEEFDNILQCNIED